jgi:hypothetical protein
MGKVGSYVITLVFLLSIVNIVSISSEAGILTEVSVEADPYVEINVEPGSIGRGVIYANVTSVNYNVATPLIVSLFAESTIGSPSLNSPQIVFQGSYQSEVIMISILVPIITTSASEDQKCTITGIWQQGGTQGDVDGDFTQVIILPYYFPILSSEDPEKEVDQGDDVSFNLLVNNTGNLDDIYRFEIEDANQLEEKGIKIDAMKRMPIGEKGSQRMELSIQTSPDTPKRTYGIDLVVISVKSEEDSDNPVSVKYLLNLRVNEKLFGVGDVAGSFLPIIIIIVLIVSGIVGYQRRRKSKQSNLK